MKKHLSVLALWAENTLWKVLALLAAAGAAESVIFVLRWKGRSPDAAYPPPLEDLWRGPDLALYVSFGLLLLLLTYGSGCQKAGYTLQRLRIREETAVLWNAVYNGISCLLFWAVQAAVMLGLCSWYVSVIGPEYSSRQTVFLAVYRIPLLHNLLPLEHWTRYIALACLLAALSFSCALAAYKARRGSRYGWGMPVFLWGAAVGLFHQGTGAWVVDAFSIAVAGAALITEGKYLWDGWRGENDETH